MSKKAKIIVIHFLLWNFHVSKNKRRELLKPLTADLPPTYPPILNIPNMIWILQLLMTKFYHHCLIYKYSFNRSLIWTTYLLINERKITKVVREISTFRPFQRMPFLLPSHSKFADCYFIISIRIDAMSIFVKWFSFRVKSSENLYIKVVINRI